MIDIFRDEWIDGYRVTAFPFKDKIFTHIEYFKPGSSLSRPPVWEFTVYLSQDAEPTLRTYPTSVIRNLVAVHFANYFANKKRVYDGDNEDGEDAEGE